MNLGIVLLIIVILLLVGVNPGWSHAASFGYKPSGFLMVLLIVLIVLIATGYL